MDTAQLFFRRRHARDDDEFLDKVQTYLAALTHNGQIVGEYMMAEVSGGVLVTAGIPEADALADRHANKWVRKSLRELAALGVARPKVTRLGENLERRPSCRCRKRPFLILFTTFLDAGPPLRCGACFGPVALYKVSTYEAGNQQDVLWWQHTYQAMDWLFIGSGPGERFANDQLSRVDSPLSTDGRELARELEKRRVSTSTTTSRNTSGAGGTPVPVPFMRQGVAAKGAAASNLRLPVPALSPAVQRGVRCAVDSVKSRENAIADIS